MESKNLIAFLIRPRRPKQLARIRLLWNFVIFAVLVLAVHRSFGLSFSAIYASYTIPEVGLEYAVDEADSLILQRKIQKHYLASGIYIPIDDIIVNLEADNDPAHLARLREVCGIGKVFIWVPLRFRIPFWGEKVIEWCLTRK